MRFERYPLDEHICKFRVGSTNMDINYMRFGETDFSFDKSAMNTILDYKIEATNLRQTDRILLYQGQNYSVTGGVNMRLAICRKFCSILKEVASYSVCLSILLRPFDQCRVFCIELYKFM